jgi:hypothetical protein
MASDLALDPAALDVYLEQGMSLAELRHAARLAQQSGSELDLMAGAHASGMSWGEIKQALREAEDGGDLSAILAAGGEETRQEEREQQRQEQSASDTRLPDWPNAGTTVDQVMALFNGSCAGDWLRPDGPEGGQRPGTRRIRRRQEGSLSPTTPKAWRQNLCRRVFVWASVPQRRGRHRRRLSPYNRKRPTRLTDACGQRPVGDLSPFHPRRM